MLPRPRRTFFSSNTRAALFAGIVLLLPTHLLADPNRGNVVCRQELSSAHREHLVSKLRQITGLPDLKFDGDGILRTASNRIAGGSESARELLAKASTGRNAAVIEDASNSSEVAFCRVIPGRWKNRAAGVRRPN